MFRKSFIISFAIFSFAFLFRVNAYATVDISLIDNPGDSTLELVVNSKEANLAGINIDINFSSNLVIKNITEPDEFCNMMYNPIARNEVISIECLNDSAIPMNGVLSTIEYDNVWGGDYYFFVNQSTLDIGNNTLGNIIDVNRPEDIEIIEFEMPDPLTTELTLLDRIINFVRDYYLYISTTVALISVCLIVVLIKGRKK